MKPYRLQPLDELTELRRSIADLLDLGDEDGFSQLYVFPDVQIQRRKC